MVLGGVDSVGPHDVLGLGLVKAKGESGGRAPGVRESQLRHHPGNGRFRFRAGVKTFEEVEDQVCVECLQNVPGMLNRRQQRHYGHLISQLVQCPVCRHNAFKNGDDRLVFADPLVATGDWLIVDDGDLARALRRSISAGQR